MCGLGGGAGDDYSCKLREVNQRLEDPILLTGLWGRVTVSWANYTINVHLVALRVIVRDYCRAKS